MAGGLRDVFLLKDFTLLSGFLAIWITVTLGNLILHKYDLSALSQPVAHSQYLWSFLGMAAVGWGSILLGGCPLRQLVLSGEGNSDSAVTVLGLVVGAAFAHNFGLASSAAGPTGAGKLAVVIGLAAVALIGCLNTFQKKA